MFEIADPPELGVFICLYEKIEGTFYIAIIVLKHSTFSLILSLWVDVIHTHTHTQVSVSSKQVPTSPPTSHA